MILAECGTLALITGCTERTGEDTMNLLIMVAYLIITIRVVWYTIIPLMETIMQLPTI